MTSRIPEYTRAGPDDAVLSSSDRHVQLQNLVRADHASTFEPTVERERRFSDDICKHCGFLRHQHGENETTTCKALFDQHGRLGMGWSEVGSAMLECDDSSYYMHPAYLFGTRRGSVGWMMYAGSRDVEEGIRLEGYEPYDFEESWAIFKKRYTIPSLREAQCTLSGGGTGHAAHSGQRRRSPRRSPSRRSPRDRRRFF